MSNYQNSTGFKASIVSVSGSHFLIFFLGISLSILNARFLGPAGVGVFALLKILQELSIKVSDFGLSRACRYYSANGHIQYFVLKAMMFRMGLLVASVVVIAIFVIKTLPINIWDDIDHLVYLLFLPTPFFYVQTMYLRHLLHGQLLITQINISEILERVFYIMLFILFVGILDFGLKGVSLTLSTSTFFLYLQLVIISKKYKPQTNHNSNKFSTKEILIKLWSYGRWSYYSSFLSYFFLNFPILFLKSSTGSFSQIGYFNKAIGLSSFPKIVSVPLSGILFSYNASTDGKTAANRTNILCRYSFWGVTLLYGIVAVLIKPLIRTLYGEAFLPAAEIFLILYPSIVLHMQSLYLSSAIAARGLNKATFTIRLKSLPIVLPVMYFFITNLGATGAAIAISFSFTVLWLQYALKYRALTGSSFKDLLLFKKSDLNFVTSLFIKVLKRLKNKA